MSRSLLVDSLGATIAVFLVCGLLKLVVFSVGFLDPVHSALHHVGLEFDNHIHGQTRAPLGPSSSSICLVDIGKANRSGIAAMLTAIERQNPRLVAVDVVFDQKKAPSDTSLQRALAQLQQQRKLVMASWLSMEGEAGHSRSELHESDAPFRLGPTGYTNFVAEESDGMVRHHLPALPPLGDAPGDTLSFAARIVSIVAPATWQQYGNHRAAMKANEPDWILYQQDQRLFSRFDSTDLAPGSARLPELRNKIVLLGSMAGAADPYVSEDVHQVPLGDGTRLTGLEIHANILAMLLDGTHLRKIPDWVLWLVSFPLCWVLMMFFAWQFQRYHIWFHLVFKTVQFITAALIVLVALLLFRFGHIEMNTLPLLAPMALAVDVLYFYEGFARWLTKQSWLPKRIPYTTYFDDSHAHH
ncbi:CHASE2 domain-containing sensor protein [Spirosoma lacussanchae]|uniref:CHASE2 domain-containing protein n=1 Tax=Spirosoma lacussanchae TaxID=1884249 RepID=UPI001107DF4D|nr:CHASE2 domain-containing protein [Spirosoma lacussanchae]